MRNLIDSIVKKINGLPKFGATFVSMLLSLGMLLAIPGLILYVLISPLFSDDSMGTYLSLAKGVLLFGVVGAGLFAVLWTVSRLASKFNAVAVVLRGIGYLFLVSVICGALLQCVDGHDPECRESRYITC